MVSGKKIKKAFIILALLLVNAWFWGNAALEYSFYRTFASDAYMLAALERVPEKLVIPESKVEGEYLYFYGYKLKLPALKQEKSVKITQYLFDRRLSDISVFIKDGDNYSDFITFDESPAWYKPDKEQPLLYKLERKYLADGDSLWEIDRRVYYSRPSDFSWWNLAQNIKLFQRLTLKMISIPSVSRDYAVSYIETPNVNGFLTEVYLNNRPRPFSHFEFIFDGRDYSITLSAGSEGAYDLRDIISTIKKNEDADKAYNEMEALHKNNPGYPDGLLILTMFSLKGPVEDYQREYIIEGLKANLEFSRSTPVSDPEASKLVEDETKADIEYFQSQMEKAPK